jgi:hypothetical protein
VSIFDLIEPAAPPQPTSAKPAAPPQPAGIFDLVPGAAPTAATGARPVRAAAPVTPAAPVTTPPVVPPGLDQPGAPLPPGLSPQQREAIKRARAARITGQFERPAEPLVARLTRVGVRQQRAFQEAQQHFQRAVNELAATAATPALSSQRFLKLGKTVLAALAPLGIPSETLKREFLPDVDAALRKAGVPASAIVGIDTVLGSIADVELDPSNIVFGSPLIGLLRIRAAARVAQGMKAADAVAQSARELGQIATPGQKKVTEALAQEAERIGKAAPEAAPASLVRPPHPAPPPARAAVQPPTPPRR